MREFLFRTISLQTPLSRLLVFGVLTIAIFFSSYDWLAHLSLWDRFGLEWMPSIGLTRAYWLLIHGDPVGAWQRNGLIYLVLAVGLPILIRDAWTMYRQVK